MWTLVYFSICGWGRERIALSVIGDREGLSEGARTPLPPLHSAEQRARINEYWRSVRWKKRGISTGWMGGAMAAVRKMKRWREQEKRKQRITGKCRDVQA